MRCLSVGSLFREGLTPVRCLSVGVGPCVGLFVVDCRGLTPVRYLLIGPGLFVGLAVGWLACWSLRVWLFVSLFVGWLVRFFLRASSFGRLRGERSWLGIKKGRSLGPCAFAFPLAEIQAMRNSISMSPSRSRGAWFPLGFHIGSEKRLPNLANSNRSGVKFRQAAHRKRRTYLM